MTGFYIKHPVLLLLLFPVFASAQPLMRDFIGVNVKTTLPYERMNRVGFTRNFHLWADDQGIGTNGGDFVCPLPIPEGSGINKIRWNPSYATGRYTRYDEFYALNPQRTIAVLHGNAPVMYGNSGELFAKPCCPEFNATVPGDPNDDANIHADPNSWKAIAIRASLFSARYGASSTIGFPAGFEQIAAKYIAAPDHTGLARGTVKYIEVFNEPDAAWHGADGINISLTGSALENDPGNYSKYYFRPDQYAAMLSAVYDGNKNSSAFEIRNANNQTVGHWGIHNLSPNTKVVLAGTADMRYDYLHFMRVKWDELRGPGDYPFDVVNYHFYSTTTHPAINDNTSTNPNATWDAFYRGRTFFGNGQGAFPESDNVNLRARISKLLSDRYATPSDFYGDNVSLFPDKPTWITEFGYDTKGTTATSVVPFCGFDAQTIQGQWITRYIMEASAARSLSGGLVVEKVFMYELNDDPSLGNGLFGNSGLLKTDGSPKKSWFHLRTLKSVLDATRFTKTNSDYSVAFLKDGVVLSADDPRLYTYSLASTSSNGPTIAAWVPKGKNDDCELIKYKGAILIKKLTSQINEPKPTIQAIEVMEHDEDGRRTKIDPSLIESVTLVTPNNETFNYWQINGIRPGDAQITLTETPIYLRVNQPFSESDRVPLPVENLAATCLGCNAAQLTWTKPVGQSYAYYSVYYQAIENNAPVPAFDPQAAILVVDRLPGSVTDAIVTDLENNVKYVFWVVPYTQNKNGGASSGVFTYTPVDMSVPEEGRHFVVKNDFNCSSCGIPFDQSQVSITQNPWVDPNNPTPFPLTAFWEALFPPDPATICSDLMNGASATPFGIQVGDGKTLQFIVDFDEPKYIDALYIFYATGTGRITIEYQEDCCDKWIKFNQIDTKDLSQGTANFFWYRIVNTLLNKVRIEKLRFTIVGLPETGINLKRFYLCARTAPDLCAEDAVQVVSQDELITPPTDAEVKYVDTHSAMVGWNPARHFVNNQEQNPLHRYTVRYGITTDAAGEIIQPTIRNYDGPEWGGDNELPLSPLVPNTTYYVDIFPDPEVYPCIKSAKPVARLRFTTLPTEKNAERSALNNEVSVTPLLLSPNPAGDVLRVQVPTNTYAQYRILHVNGVLIREGMLPFKQNLHEIGLKDLPNGVYIIALTGPAVPPEAKAFVIHR